MILAIDNLTRKVFSCRVNDKERRERSRTHVSPQWKRIVSNLQFLLTRANRMIDLISPWRVHAAGSFRVLCRVYAFPLHPRDDSFRRRRRHRERTGRQALAIRIRWRCRACSITITISVVAAASAITIKPDKSPLALLPTRCTREVLCRDRSVTVSSFPAPRSLPCGLTAI